MKTVLLYFSWGGWVVAWTVLGDGLKGTDVVLASSVVRQPTLLKQTEQNYINLDLSDHLLCEQFYIGLDKTIRIVMMHKLS